MNTSIRARALLLAVAMAIIISASARLQATTGTCSGQMITLPFTDVPAANIFFCSIAQAYFTGLTNGTDATHYSPSANVPREQMAAFITRTMDQSIKRSSRRAALDQFWTSQNTNNILGLTTVGIFPLNVKSDGVDLWVANWSGDNTGGCEGTDGTVSRVRASTGKLLQTWRCAGGAWAVLVALGKVYVTGATGGSSGRLYQLDPANDLAAPAAVLLTGSLGASPVAIAFDGARIWTANQGGSVSIITLHPPNAPTVVNVSTGFIQPTGIIFDGTNIWVTDSIDNALKKLNSNGVVIQSVPVGARPRFPAFDGTNIWVPNSDDTISVVRATGGLAGTVFATLNGNGLNGPNAAAFDGERIMVTNLDTGFVSLWRATDLSPIGAIDTGHTLYGVCSDGINFWLPLNDIDKLARF